LQSYTFFDGVLWRPAGEIFTAIRPFFQKKQNN